MEPQTNDIVPILIIRGCFPVHDSECSFYAYLAEPVFGRDVCPSPSKTDGRLSPRVLSSFGS